MDTGRAFHKAGPAMEKALDPDLVFIEKKIPTTVEPAMSSHSYEQPTSYGRPLGHSPNWHFVYKCTSHEQPPAFKGHIICVARVAAHSRFYCIASHWIIYFWYWLKNGRIIYPSVAAKLDVKNCICYTEIIYHISYIYIAISDIFRKLFLSNQENIDEERGCLHDANAMQISNIWYNFVIILIKTPLTFKLMCEQVDISWQIWHVKQWTIRTLCFFVI